MRSVRASKRCSTARRRRFSFTCSIPTAKSRRNFLEYVVRTTDGRVLTGLIAGESDAGLTLRRAQNQEDNILRSEIEEIASSGKSLMPEGLEQKITPQDMADLIAYLKKTAIAGSKLAPGALTRPLISGTKFGPG